MNLQYIHLGLDYEDYADTHNKLRFEVQKRTNFIDDFFSKAIRKHKFKTDGTFKMISISLTEFEIKPSAIVPFDVLQVYIPFDKSRYDKIKGTEDCSYYLELLEQGFRKAAEFKTLPLDVLLALTKDFRARGCKNEWLHKRKKFKKQDLEIVLTCEFTTNYFELFIAINKMSSKEELVKGLIIRTETGVSIHEGMFKDVIIEDDILITDKSDSPRIIINKDDVFNKKLNYTIVGDKKIKEILSFEL